ncbi:hypothetical protein IFM89_034888 [Coptis chinensis]|uniref:Uncharacterized protein n=1 Tax=Coptis chinensis TaxID=261450 RepID=A0A835I320_9MAGN|nr:hypothetical protein IFM89_034888 [Coptis chinensis]
MAAARQNITCKSFTEGFGGNVIKNEIIVNPEILSVEVGELSRCLELLKGLKCRVPVEEKILEKGYFRAGFEVKRRVDCLCRHGMILRETFKVVQREPMVILYDLEDIEKKIEFLKHKMRFGVGCLNEVLEYLGVNFDKQIVLRHNVFEYLRSKGGLGSEVGLQGMIKSSRLQFYNLYVKPYPDCEKIFGRFSKYKEVRPRHPIGLWKLFKPPKISTPDDLNSCNCGLWFEHGAKCKLSTSPVFGVECQWMSQQSHALDAGLDGDSGCAGAAGGLVVVRDLDLFSYCESCLLPFRVKCHDPQRLADEVCSSLYNGVGPAGVGVVLQCWHIEFPQLDCTCHDQINHPTIMDMQGQLKVSVCAGAGVFVKEAGDVWGDFLDRVGSLKEGIEFLEVCGFEKIEGGEFLFLPRDKVDMAVLNSAGSELNSAIVNPFFGVL